MLKWYLKAPIFNPFGGGMILEHKELLKTELQNDWNQTLMTIINIAVRSVQEKKALNIGKGRMFKRQVEPQLSCPENMKEIMSSLAFYDKEKQIISGIETHSFIRPVIHVDFNNELKHIIYYRHDHTIAIELVDDHQPN